MTSIEFEKYGRVFINIYAKPVDDNIMLPIQFKVDTGADMSTIAKADLARLGYDMDWIKENAIVFEDKDKPTTASGDKINAGYVQLPLINILEYEGKKWPFQIIMDEQQDFRNLMGRDLLTGFNYEFNNDDDVFTIRRANKFKPRYKFILGQEIHEILIGDSKK
ncbi:MAG: retropepsin-like domain-containing protein [Defluviitaleaceae bacterium]|nr:retropepsin-like domain-containing protein [Defluviitaleaceae bacterium]MCL2273468.1 retropepsin-like domain-containing protein [Defluviitaleaceae bacterium]